MAAPRVRRADERGEVLGGAAGDHHLHRGRIVVEGLARFEQIKTFCIVDTPLTVARGLLTSTLKVRRKKVYEAFGAQFEALYG